MLAHAILTVIAARERDRHTADDQTLIPLTFNEIRRLFARLITNTDPHHRPLAALVELAPPTPSPRQDQPLPPPGQPKIATSRHNDPGLERLDTFRVGGLALIHCEAFG